MHRATSGGFGRTGWIVGLLFAGALVLGTIWVARPGEQPASWSSLPGRVPEDAAGGDHPASDRTSYRVLEVIDGDTIAVEISGSREKVRLIGVDTPETVHPNRIVERFGPEASRFVEGLLAGERVRLVLEPAGLTHDKYGRALAYVYRASDELFVNAEIIRLGYGHVYTRFPFQHMEEFRALEREAREAERGLWGDAPPPATTAGATGARGGAVYVTPAGKRYHLRECRHLSADATRITQSEAEARGLEPCATCAPER